MRIFLSPFSLSVSLAMSLFSKYLKNRHRSELVTPAGEKGGRGEGEGRERGGRGEGEGTMYYKARHSIKTR